MKNTFTESPSSEIIEGNQVISEKYCGQKDTDIGEILSRSDGGGITFDDNLRINILDNHFKHDKNFEFPRKLVVDIKVDIWTLYFACHAFHFQKAKKTILQKFQVSVNDIKQVRKLKNIAVILFMIEACLD